MNKSIGSLNSRLYQAEEKALVKSKHYPEEQNNLSYIK